jgi:CBS domain-containing protein
MPTRPIRGIVRDQRLVTAGRQLPVREAARLMAREKVGALLVIESDRLLGIFTERDALYRVLAAGLDADRTTIGEVMTEHPTTVSPDRPLAHALCMMYDNGFRHLPVVEGGRVIGIVSARDALGGDLLEFEKELQHREELAERMR